MIDDFEERLDDLDNRLVGLEGKECGFTPPSGGPAISLQAVSLELEMLRLRVRHLENEAIRHGWSIS